MLQIETVKIETEQIEGNFRNDLPTFIIRRLVFITRTPKAFWLPSFRTLHSLNNHIKNRSPNQKYKNKSNSVTHSVWILLLINLPVMAFKANWEKLLVVKTVAGGSCLAVSMILSREVVTRGYPDPRAVANPQVSHVAKEANVIRHNDLNQLSLYLRSFRGHSIVMCEISGFP